MDYDTDAESQLESAELENVGNTKLEMAIKNLRKLTPKDVRTCNLT